MEHSPRASIRFGDFELRGRPAELWRQGVTIPLQEKPLQMLQMLLEEPGRLVSRDELRRRLWPTDIFVDFDHGINNAIKRLREALGDTAEAPRYIETVPRRGYRFVAEAEQEASLPRGLAVLPLENLSGDPEQVFFVEGLTEALITTLAKISKLRVISRTSSMLYKGVRKPLREIAQELEVDWIIEGSALRIGPRVRITAQLIDVRDKEAHLWAESYERGLSDVLALHADVAQAIAREVCVKLSPEEQANFARAYIVDPEAYEFYLKGRYHWNRRTREGHSRAVQYFQQAIEKDPGYAAPYAGLADALTILGLWGLLSPDDGYGKAKELAKKALEIDPNLPEAYTSFGWAILHYDNAYVEAEKYLQRAVELNPRLAIPHHWFGMALGMLGRYEEAFTELKRAIRLDPHWSLVRFGMAFVYWCGRHYELAVEEAREALELDPNSPQAHVWLGLSHMGLAEYHAAIDALQKAVELSRRAPVALACLGEAYAASGNIEAATRITDELSGHTHMTAYFLGRIYVALGDIDKAFDWLELAYREHAEWMGLLKIDPRFDELREDARIQDLLRRMKFPCPGIGGPSRDRRLSGTGAL
jgi:TolB-like protein/Flp pilus assembly protein TadD